MKLRLNKLATAAKAAAKTVKSATEQTVKKAVQTVQASKPGKLISSFYTHLRGGKLNLCNCRKQDFTKQVVSEGRLMGAPLKVVLVNGLHGITVSALPVKGTMADLGDGRVFDLSGLKSYKVFAPKEAKHHFRNEGRPVNAVLGVGKKQKVEHKGAIIGKMEKMYVGFYDAVADEFRTLETRAI